MTLLDAVLLPLATEHEDPDAVLWSRAVPLVVSEALRQAGARVAFDAWSHGAGAGLRLIHLTTAPSVQQAAAMAQAANARFAVCGWGRWVDAPFVKLAIVDAAGAAPRKLSVPLDPDGGRVGVARQVERAVAHLLGVERAADSVLHATERDTALQGWLLDQLEAWFARRRGETPAGGCDHVLAAVAADPDFEPAAAAVHRRSARRIARATPDAVRLATHDLTRLLAIRPGDATAWTLRGMALRATGDDDGAESALRSAIAADPDAATAHRELGTLRLRARDLRAAGALLRRAGKLAPRDPLTHHALGLLYLRQHEGDRAREHLHAVLGLAPGSELASEAQRLLARGADEPALPPLELTPAEPARFEPLVEDLDRSWLLEETPVRAPRPLPGLDDLDRSWLRDGDLPLRPPRSERD